LLATISCIKGQVNIQDHRNNDPAGLYYLKRVDSSHSGLDPINTNSLLFMAKNVHIVLRAFIKTVDDSEFEVVQIIQNTDSSLGMRII